ncbi:hypothetical protein [Bradyrhizobium oligotrophicum]|uniref:hypothetical protein n=2 Tax=Nitrobacteraceae TaxID=41294 RepID=UPI003EB8F6B8
MAHRRGECCVRDQQLEPLMIGAKISRWTMSYFAAALGWLLVALAMLVGGLGYPAAELGAPDTLVVVHAVCIGWLSLSVCGALFQFVPVLVARPLPFDKWALPALFLINVGLVCLILGFLSLAGRIAPAVWLLPAGSVVLGAGLAMVALDLGLTLFSQPKGSALFVIAGLGALCATVALGVAFAFALAGSAGAYGDALLAAAIPIHAIAGLGGWLTLTAMGVSYRLLAMFMLSADLGERQSTSALKFGALALSVGVVGGLFAIGLEAGLGAVLILAAVLGVISLALYGRDIATIYRSRKRRQLELNMRMATVSFANLAATVTLGAVIIVSGKVGVHVGAFAFLAVFGWLSGLIFAKLYKIVAFLTWLETYGPVMGRAQTPRVQDLAVERRSEKWFIIYFLGVWAATIMLMMGEGQAFRGAAAVMAVGSIGIIHELVRVRRLSDVAGSRRLPAGAIAPSLLFARN